MAASLLRKSFILRSQLSRTCGCGQVRLLAIPGPDGEPPIPEWEKPKNETIQLQRARLLYQSRKRGMSENGILFSTFADQYLNKLTDEQLQLYDVLINKPNNDWEIYYWVTKTKPTPVEYDNEVMDLLKTHASNPKMEARIRQPDLNFDQTEESIK